MRDVLNRALRAAIFDRRTIDEAMWERNTTADAVLLIAGISALRVLWSAFTSSFGVTSLISSLIRTAISDVAGWLFLAVVTWFIGSRMFTAGESFRRGFEHSQTMMRAHGITYLPMVLAVFGGIVAIVGQVWYLAAAAVATSVALDVKLSQGVVSLILGMAGLFLFRTLFSLPFALFSGF